jgi:CBS domain-containing protein
VALEDAGVGCLAVGKPDAVEGVVSERDILRAVAEGLDLDATSVGGVESTELKWATPSTASGLPTARQPTPASSRATAACRSVVDGSMSAISSLM